MSSERSPGVNQDPGLRERRNGLRCCFPLGIQIWPVRPSLRPMPSKRPQTTAITMRTRIEEERTNVVRLFFVPMLALKMLCVIKESVKESDFPPANTFLSAEPSPPQAQDETWSDVLANTLRKISGDLYASLPAASPASTQRVFFTSQSSRGTCLSTRRTICASLASTALASLPTARRHHSHIPMTSSSTDPPKVSS